MKHQWVTHYKVPRSLLNEICDRLMDAELHQALAHDNPDVANRYRRVREALEILKGDTILE